MAAMWMVRGDGGRLYDEFRDREIAAIGWNSLAALAVKPGIKKEDLIQALKLNEPGIKDGTAISGASQVFRFVNEITAGDWVVTYSPANRTYLVGQVKGPAVFNSDLAAEGMALCRPINWLASDISRDQLTISSKNSLGSTLTLFKIPVEAQTELVALAKGASGDKPLIPLEKEQVLDDPLAGLEEMAFERIKDQINSLDWDELQELVAGILRAMGYKTQVSPAGSDRGKDIIASPDGFGFQQPRIVVEVKHRDGRMSSDSIRSFLGGRHKDDRGLYVSTGGFTKDALYEAERAPVPLALWTIDELAKALMLYYPSADTQTQQLVPLKYFYVPV